ncbi:MAG: DNA recombination protein RmuC [Firmicutes bacterium]|nr:DNA recombination protein RmuC [Bacillota bacterium]
MIITAAVLIVVVIAALILMKRQAASAEMERRLLAERENARLREEARRTDQMIETLRMMSDVQDKRLDDLQTELNRMALENEIKLDNIRTTLETRLNSMQNDNNEQLEKMRDTVDEKLQKTLEERLAKSFSLVNDQLEKVTRGFGEMNALASNVGDLKKVLSNVKTRGNLGELQLGSILREILAPEQFDENVETRKGSGERVEFAVRLPGDGDSVVYLPIDAKFPADTYAALVDAYERGDRNDVDRAKKALRTVLRKEAKDIREKYIDPPATTDFAVMFLPVEGLYAEAVRIGMVEELQQNEFKVNLAGPTTMAALLNSLQMGFRTLAIQKHSSEVWDTLAGVKTEFAKFAGALEKVQTKLGQASNDLTDLVGVRTRQINRKLKDVETLDGYDSDLFLPDADDVMTEE